MRIYGLIQYLWLVINKADGASHVYPVLYNCLETESHVIVVGNMTFFIFL